MDAVHSQTQTPLLTFAIMHRETIETDTTNIVRTLLSLGASPLALPQGLCSPCCKDLAADGLDSDSLGSLTPPKAKWLTKSAMTKLARTTHLTHRYNLERAANIKRPSIRHRQVARFKNTEAIIGLPYFLIGQSIAATMLVRKCLTYLTVPTKRPLVLCFAGPSGHGKTELARRLGHLMSLELEVVDCTTISREMELFGPRHPYANAEQGVTRQGHACGQDARKAGLGKSAEGVTLRSRDIYVGYVVYVQHRQHRQHRRGRWKAI
jgi:hypothetical protein